MKFVILTLLSISVIISCQLNCKTENDRYWESLEDLNDVDSLSIYVRHYKLHHAALSFNSEYKTTTWNLNYKIINGDRFKWEEFHPPFNLYKKSSSDTIVISKNGKNFKFLFRKNKSK